MQWKHLPAKKSVHFKRVVFAGLIVTGGFVGICVMVLNDMARRDYDLALSSEQNVVAALDSEIQRNLELYDLSLQAVVEGLKVEKVQSADPELRQMILFDRAATAKHMGSILVLDRKGVVILDSRTTDVTPDNFSDTDYFKAFANGSTAERFISRPSVNIRREHLISISRPVLSANGAFDGIVVGTLRLSYFHDLFRKITLRDGDSLFITTEDGAMVMRAPFDVNLIGRDVSKSPISVRMAASDEGHFVATPSLDNTKRLYFYRRVGEHPLRIGYGQSIEGIYAGWWKEAKRLGAMVLLLCLMNIALIVFLARAMRKHGIAENALAENSMTDGLTGLCNRRRFNELFEIEWRRAQRNHEPLAVIMIDADQFKSYNDCFGHQKGDGALISIANCIAFGTRRGADFGARYGGEEFVILLPGKTAEEARKVAENIRQSVLDVRTQQQDRADCTPTVSIGIASVIPSTGLEMADLIGAADNALYEAKRAGRNCAKVYETAILLPKQPRAA